MNDLSESRALLPEEFSLRALFAVGRFAMISARGNCGREIPAHACGGAQAGQSYLRNGTLVVDEADDEAAENGEVENLTKMTARRIGMAIVSGEVNAECVLPVEAEMMKQYGVSRNVLREAVKMLAGKGLLKTTRRAGTHIQPRHAWNMLDVDVLKWTMASPGPKARLLRHLTELRFIIEPEVAALAAVNASATETLRIQEAYDAMERNVHDAERAVAADIEFHARLLDASHNELLRSLLPSLEALLRGNFELAIHAPGGFIRNLEEHRLVAKAVADGKSHQARRAMRLLLKNNAEDMGEWLNTNGAEARFEDGS